MQRVDTPTKAVDLFGVGKHGFTDGDGGSIAPTNFNAAISNAIQEAIARAIEGMGITLDGLNHDQLLDAIRNPHGSGTGAAVAGIGGSTSGTGLKGTGGGPNGKGIEGFGVGTGAGGEFTAGASAPAAKLVGNAAPEVPLIELTAQAQPTTPAAPGIYYDSTTRKICAYNTAHETFDRYVPQAYALLAQVSRTTAGSFAGATHSIKAGSLKQGSTIRVIAACWINVATAGTCTLRLRLGSIILLASSLSTSLAIGQHRIRISAEITVRTSGAAGAISLIGQCVQFDVSGGSSASTLTSDSPGFDTTIDQNVYVDIGGMTAAGAAFVEQFIVDVT